MSSKFPPKDDAEARKPHVESDAQDEPREAAPEPDTSDSDVGPLTKLAAETPHASGTVEGPVEDATPQALPRAEFPDLKPLSKGQVGGFGIEALEAYRFGERNRFDQNGALWRFRREVHDNRFELTITISLLGVTLATGALPLDRVASAEGERQMLALVETLAETAVKAGKAVKVRQEGLAKEGLPSVSESELARQEVDRCIERARAE